ncbi:pathogen-associated molecular patterns-induced protein A70 [Senna tora]|uniref:Pathogen-associated molecular patterns-induced protein A70 n=1 Tax=Senna tora TaxID=362788 RepID=A0A834U4W3_9FABA|nr:pathogen-associated molecular patterns-induced protein A70 [Senna tora]
MFLNQPQNPPLLRSPSMLQMLKSINLYNYFQTEPISSKIATPGTTHFDFTNTHDSERHPLGNDVNVEESDEEEEDQDDQVRHEAGVWRGVEKAAQKVEEIDELKVGVLAFQGRRHYGESAPTTMREAKVSESEADKIMWFFKFGSNDFSYNSNWLNRRIKSAYSNN